MSSDLRAKPAHVRRAVAEGADWVTTRGMGLCDEDGDNDVRIVAFRVYFGRSSEDAVDAMLAADDWDGIVDLTARLIAAEPWKNFYLPGQMTPEEIAPLIDGRVMRNLSSYDGGNGRLVACVGKLRVPRKNLFA